MRFHQFQSNGGSISMRKTIFRRMRSRRGGNKFKGLWVIFKAYERLKLPQSLTSGNFKSLVGRKKSYNTHIWLKLRTISLQE